MSPDFAALPDRRSGTLATLDHPSAGVPVLAAVLVFAWVWLSASLNQGQLGDHFEEFAWAHSMEWGYYKHPPMPIWLLSSLIALLGPATWATYVLSGLFNAGTAVLTFLIARTLFNGRVATLAVILWGLDYKYSVRAEWWNHNTTLIFFTALTIWLAMRAVLSGRQSWWGAAGMAGGLAMLSKYQAAIPLFGMLIALWHSGALKDKTHQRGLALAALLALLLFLPHIAWVFNHHFSTIKYAAQQENHLDLLGRLKTSVSFLAIQTRMLFPALLCLFLASRLRQDQAAPASGTATAGQPESTLLPARSWLIGLVWFPIAAVLCTALFGGLRLMDHWGYQTMQFFPLILARRFAPRLRIDLKRLLLLAGLIHLASMYVHAQAVLHPSGSGRPDTSYPAQAIAQAALHDWRAATNCPLRFVVGPSFEAGMISLYSGEFPAVLEANQPDLSPWIDMAQLNNAGALYIETDPPATAVKHSVFTFRLPGADNTEERTIRWSVVPPQTCDSALPDVP
ncbi:MAG: glycosyltransferase family 39 protein [Leptothrix sp. (in: b-proteobacteria)]